jgi:hypothetical protein
MDSSSSSSSSTTSSLQLAMAALCGGLTDGHLGLLHPQAPPAPHQDPPQTLSQCRQPFFHRVLYDEEAEEAEEAEAEEEEERDDDGGYGSDGEMVVDRKMWGRSLSRSLDENMLRSYKISASLPNVEVLLHMFTYLILMYMHIAS